MRITDDDVKSLNSTEAEKGILSSILLEPTKALGICKDNFRTEFFFNPSHRQIYEAILGLEARSQPVDVITLAAELQKDRILDSCGGPAYLCELNSYLPTWLNLVPYIEITRECFYRRKLLSAASDLASAVSEPDTLSEVTTGLVEVIQEWRDQKVSTEIDPTDQRAEYQQLIEELEYEYDNQGSLMGIPTGIRWLDQMIGGLVKETFYLIGGRPSDGKSLMLSQMATHAVRTPRKDGSFHKVLIFSIEMSGKRWRKRLISQDEIITSGAIASSLYTEKDFLKLPEHIDHMKRHHFVCTQAGLSVKDVCAIARRGLKKHPDIDWIGLDYLQLLRPSTPGRNKQKHEEIAEACQELNALKKELGVPIVACAALNREVENRKDRRPKLSDTAGSGQIEYDIDTGILLHMEENSRSIIREGNMIVAKNRDGSTDSHPIWLNKRWLKFHDSEPK